MYFDEPVDSTVPGGSTLMRAVLGANALMALGLGLMPGALFALCAQVIK
jgi:hypothetical protein